MFSGGIDSTGVFWQLLKEGRKIHVHHMNLKNVERRARAESLAVRGILGYLKTVGAFLYSESTHAYPVLNGQFLFDSDMASFIAGNICMQEPWIKEVTFGLTHSDTDSGVSTRIGRANKIFGAFETNATKTYPLKTMTKQQVYDMLPKELRSLTWSCRSPLYDANGQPSPCNTCRACHEKNALNHG